MLFRKITSKSTGGRGNPPLQRGAESSPPTLKLHFYFSIGTVKTVPYNFSLFIFHYSSIFGSSRTPTPTHEIECVCPTNPNFRMGLLCPSLPTVKCGHLQNGEKCISVCVVFAIQTDFLCFCVRFYPLQPKVSADFRRCKAECMAQPTRILVCSCCRKEKSTHAF